MTFFPNAEDLQSFSSWSQLFFIAVYFYILFRAAEWIGEGSDRLMDLYGPGIVGGLIIPVLGAVPEGAITLFSGLGACPQLTLDIGIGTLCGSTVMLLTVPFAVSIFVGAKPLDEQTGRATEERVSLMNFVVTVYDSNVTNAKWMMLTAIGYVAPLIPAVVYRGSSLQAPKVHGEVLLGLLVSLVIFMAYSIWTIRLRNDDEPADEYAPIPTTYGSDEVSMPTRVVVPLQDTVEADYMSLKRDEQSDKADGEDEVEETDNEKFYYGLAYVTVGAVVTVIFSDPMVSSITAFSKTMNIRPFFMSFFLTPAVGNITEVYASTMFASRKTTEGVSASLSTLYGAVTMNNSFVLAVFCLMVFSQNLAWNFIAETLIILVTVLAVGAVSLKTTIPVWQGVIIAALFPLTLMFIGLFGHSINGPVELPAHCRT